MFKTYVTASSASILYIPTAYQMEKLGGFIITRDAASPGGDFVTYIKDVKVPSTIRPSRKPVTDINDENVWGIVGAKEAARKNIESQRFGAQQVLRYLEALKQEPKVFQADGTTK